MRPNLNNSQQNISWWGKNGEFVVNFVLGLAIALCTAWGLYIGISIHL